METQRLSSRESAGRLSVHVKTVNRWCRAGRLPGARLRNNSRRLGWSIPAEVVEAIAAGVAYNTALPQASFFTDWKEGGLAADE